LLAKKAGNRNLKIKYKSLLSLMMTIFKLLLLFAVIANLLLIYSSVVAYFLIKEDKKSIKNFCYEDEDYM